uniref:MTP large subunit lipid-binding domain-containing protein n=1 Tax=Trichuris muris TaxID=70415 RepID=A0A5S6QZZ9_TRIMR
MPDRALLWTLAFIAFSTTCSGSEERDDCMGRFGEKLSRKFRLNARADFKDIQTDSWKTIARFKALVTFDIYANSHDLLLAKVSTERLTGGCEPEKLCNRRNRQLLLISPNPSNYTLRQLTNETDKLEWSLEAALSQIFMRKTNNETCYGRGIEVIERKDATKYNRQLIFHRLRHGAYKLKALSVSPDFTSTLSCECSRGSIQLIRLVDLFKIVLPISKQEFASIQNEITLQPIKEEVLQTKDCDGNDMNELIRCYTEQTWNPDSADLESLMLETTVRSSVDHETPINKNAFCELTLSQLENDVDKQWKRMAMLLSLRQQLEDMPESEISGLLNKCASLNQQENLELANVLATCSTLSCLKAATPFLKTIGLVDRYFTILAHLPNPGKDLIEQLMENLQRSSESTSTLLHCTAALIQTYCDKMNCSPDEPMLKRIQSLIMENGKQANDNGILRALRNLRHAFVPQLKDSLCSINGTNGEVLSLLAQGSLIPIKIDQTLRRILMDRCPTRQRLSHRMAAAKILIETDGVENLLRHFDCRKTEQAKELCALIVASVKNNWKTSDHERQKLNGMMAKLGWDIYSNITSAAMSTYASRLLFEDHTTGLSFRLKALFDDSVIEDSSFEVFAEEDDVKNSIISFGITSEGLQNVLGRHSTENATESTDQTKLKLEVHSSFFSVHQPSVVAFSDYESMSNLVWQADGTTQTLVDFVIPFQMVNLFLPLSNGLLLGIRLNVVTHFLISGSLYVSIWYSTANVNVTASFPTLLQNKMTLRSAVERSTYWQYESTLQLKPSLQATTDLDFGSVPTKACIQLNSESLHVRFNRSSESYNLKNIEGHCHLVDAKVTSYCAQFHDKANPMDNFLGSFFL